MREVIVSREAWAVLQQKPQTRDRGDSNFLKSKVAVGIWAWRPLSFMS